MKNKKPDQIIDGLIVKFANSYYSPNITTGTLSIFKIGYDLGQLDATIDDIDMDRLYKFLKSHIKRIQKN